MEKNTFNPDKYRKIKNNKQKEMVWQFHVLFAIALGDPDFISMAKLLFLEGGGIHNFISWLTPIYPVQKLGFEQTCFWQFFPTFLEWLRDPFNV